MTATATPFQDLARPRSQSQALTLADIAAPCVLALYVVLKYAPFDLLVHPPGLSSSVVFPAFGIAVLVITPADRLARIPVSFVVIAFALWLVMSRLWSVSEGSTDFMIRSEVPPLLVLMLVAGTMQPERVVKSLVAVSTAIGLWSLATSLVLPKSRAAVMEAGIEEPQLGFRGTFLHKNQLGIFMVFALCLVLAAVHGRARRWLIVLCLVLIIGSRSATAGSGLGAVLFLWFSISAIRSQRGPRERSVLFLVSLTSALFSIVLALRLLPSLLGIYQKDLTFSGRTVIWRESLHVIADRPLQGYGFGGLWIPDPPNITLELQRRIGFDAAHAHNGTIAMLLEVGIVGLVLFALVFFRAAALTTYAIRRPAKADYGRWGLLTLTGLILMSLSEPLFQVPHLGLLVILIVVLARIRNDEAAPRRRVPPGFGARP